MSACDVEGCDEASRARGFCSSHYQRFHSYGDPTITFLKNREVYERMVFRGIERRGECLLFTGMTNTYGYGAIRDAMSSSLSRTVATHRVAYEKWHGSIPDNLQVDHVCHTEALRRGDCAGGKSCYHRRCINPGHLELKTIQENSSARRKRPRRTSGRPCLLMGCSDVCHGTGGYCNKHYARAYRNGNPFTWKSGSRGGRVNLEIHELKGAR